MRSVELPEHVKRILFLGAIVVGVIMVIGMGLNALASPLSPSKPGAVPSATPAKTLKISPLLFGTNLKLSQNDQPQAATQMTPAQRLLQTMHVQIVRISLTEKPTQQEITRQAQYIRGIGAVPLVSL